jgi:transcriptional antiterminator NusG
MAHITSSPLVAERFEGTRVNGESERRDETVSDAPETEALDSASKAAEEGAVQPVSPADEPIEASPTEPTTDDAAATADTQDVNVVAEPEVAPETTQETASEPTDEERGSEDTDEIVEPLDEVDVDEEEAVPREWYILKVQVNREESIRDALTRRVKIAGLEEFFGDIVVPTEDVAEFNKSGKRRIVKKKLYPGYIMVHLSLNDDTWFLVRETPGIGDFTGSAGKPTPMDPVEVKRIIHVEKDTDSGEPQVKTAIPFKPGDRVRVKEGYFENFEGDVESIDEANGRVTVMINIFGRSTPVELEHWQIEAV